MFRPKIFVMAAALLCVSPVLAAAEPEESAGVVTTVNGDATLLRAVAAAQPVSLQMRDEIFVRDRIQTRERSLVRVLLGGKALITVRELSILTVTEEAGRVTVDLQSGKVGVAVVKARMRPGEVIEIRTPNATAAVRGTVFVVEVDPMQPGQPGGAPATTTRVHLFHGALDVSARLDPNNATVRLAELQSVVVAGNVLGSVKPISRDAVATLTADLKPQQVQVPDAPSEFTGGLVAREQGRAVMLAAALLAPTPTAPVQGTLKNVTGTVNGLNQVVTGNTAETLERLMDSLGLETVGDALGNTVDALGTNVVGGALSGVGGAVSGLGGTVASLGNTVGGLGGTVGGLGGTVGGLGGTVGGLGGTVGGLGGTVGGLGGTVGGLGGTVGGLGGAVGGTVGGLGGVIGGLGGTVGGTVGGLGGGTVGGVVGGLGGGVGHLLGH
jgi:FecR protein